ncbi:MAG: DUF192 domain-containing protein [Candidatus Parcubacteria bacterium]|nr:DUF192 domain-containing protein [Candidatus Parcubacteria bacterium]
MEILKTQKKSNNNIIFAVIFLVVIIIIVVVLTSFFSIYSNNNPMANGQVKIDGKVIKVDIAKTPEEQANGLSGWEKLADNQGMLFVFKDKRYRDFWMQGMKFPIDIIWIEDNKIIDIAKNTPVPTDENNPPIYRPLSEVNYVLEVKAGYCEAKNIKVGDTVEYIIK